MPKTAESAHTETRNPAESRKSRGGNPQIPAAARLIVELPRVFLLRRLDRVIGEIVGRGVYIEKYIQKSFNRPIGTTRETMSETAESAHAEGRNPAEEHAIVRENPQIPAAARFNSLTSPRSSPRTPIAWQAESSGRIYRKICAKSPEQPDAESAVTHVKSCKSARTSARKRAKSPKSSAKNRQSRDRTFNSRTSRRSSPRAP